MSNRANKKLYALRATLSDGEFLPVTDLNQYKTLKGLAELFMLKREAEDNNSPPTNPTGGKVLSAA